MSNLRLLNETEADSVANINITDVFTTDFDIYKIQFDFGFNATSNVNAKLINSSGSVISASDYDFAYLQLRTDTTFPEGRGTNSSSFFYLGSATSASGLGGGTSLYIFNPFSNSAFTFMLWQNQSGYSSSLAMGYKGISVLKQLSSITGIQLTTASSNNFTNTTIKTYGLRVDT